MEQELAGLEPDIVEQPLHKGRLIKIAGLVAALAVLAAAALFFWNRQSHFSERESLTRAQAFMAAGQLQAATIELKNALQANPRNTQTRLSLARLFLNQGMGAEAEEQLNRARELGADKKFATLPLAEALVLQRKYDKVLQEIKPDDFVQAAEHLLAVRIRADALLGLGKLNEACPLFQQTRATDPKHVPAYWGLIKCAVARKDFPVAKEYMEAAIKLEPHNIRSMMIKGDLAQTMGDLAGAETAYGQILDVDPGSVVALLARANVRLTAGKLALAAKDVDAAGKHAPNGLMVRYMQALLAYRQGRLSDAHNILLELVAKAPDHLPSRVLAGNVAFRLGHYQLADKETSQALVWLPQNRNLRLTLARSRLKMRQPEGALAALEPMLQSDKDTEVLALVGDAYLQMGKFSKAAEYLDKAATLMPGEPSLRSRVGLERMRAGDLAGAIKELESAVRMGATPQKTEAWEIMIHLIRKEYDQALDLAGKLEKQLPNQPLAHDLKGIAYLGKNDAAKARQSFERALAAKPTDIAATRILAQLELKERKVGAARTHYEAILKHDPNHYEALMELALLAKVEGNEAAHVSWLTRAAQAAPNETPPCMLLARHYLAKKDPLKALAWARKAYQLSPRNPQAVQLLADTQAATGDKKSAGYTYQLWTFIAPKSALAFYQLGSTQMAVGDPVSARESLQQALKIRPDYAEAAMALALLELKYRKHQEAINIARQIQRYHPKNWQGYALEGDSHADLGRYAEAAKAYEQAFGLRRRSELLIRLHQALTQAGKTEHAQQVMAQWLRESPKDAVSRLYLADSLSRAGQNAQAMAEYQIVLNAQPANVAALTGMAGALHAQKDARAVQYAEQAYQKSGRSAATSDLLGWILLSRGETGRGLELLRGAELLDPNNPAIRYHLAVAWARSGEQGMARHLLETLLAKGADFPQRAEAQALLKSLPAPKAGGRP